MASTAYPAALDSFDPAPRHLPLAPEVQKLMDAVAAVQAKLGITGNGYVPVRSYLRCHATRTFSADTNLNPIFTTPTNGTLTLGIGAYVFEALLNLSTMSATSGNALVDILGAGTATMTNILQYASGIDATDTTAAATQTGAFALTKAFVASMVTAATGTGMGVFIKGTFELSVAGTIIPSLKLVTANAAVVQIGSYFLVESVGLDTATSAGPAS